MSLSTVVERFDSAEQLVHLVGAQSYFLVVVPAELDLVEDIERAVRIAVFV